MFCRRCGAQFPNGAKACPNCGLVFESASAPMANVVPKANNVQQGQAGLQSSASQQVSGGQQGSGGQNYNAVTDAVGGLVGGLAGQINSLTGNDDRVELHLGNFFDSVFKHHGYEEIDELFACGTPQTTPDVRLASREWPHPWVYSRVLALLVAVTAVCAWVFTTWYQPVVLGTIMFVGSLAVPLATLVFFFETNALRNISIARVIEVFFAGGVASIAVSFMVFQFFPDAGSGELMPAIMTGLVEEIGKILIVAFFLSRTRGKNYILNGLLLGAAVGAGFAVFESAGYAFDSFITSVSKSHIAYINAGDFTDESYLQMYAQMWSPAFEAMLDTVRVRAFLAIGGHVVWAAVEGAALAMCEGDSGFRVSLLGDTRFLAMAVLCIVLHGLWDTMVPFIDEITLPIVGTPKYVLLIVLIWIVVMVMLHRGLSQLNEYVGR